MARPRKYINRKLLKQLAMAQLTNEEIGSCVGLKFEHLMSRYGTAIKAWRSKGPGSARHRLFTEGMAGNTACLIFYLKNYAGMSDHRESKPLDSGALPIPDEFREADKSNPETARIH